MACISKWEVLGNFQDPTSDPNKNKTAEPIFLIIQLMLVLDPLKVLGMLRDPLPFFFLGVTLRALKISQDFPFRDTGHSLKGTHIGHFTPKIAQKSGKMG